MNYDELRMYAEIFSDVQEFRKASANKIRSKTISDDAARMTDVIGTFEQVEHEMSLAMRRQLRKCAGPNVIAWQKSQLGIGEHLFARLIGIIGDPYHAQPYRWQGTGSKRVLVADEPYSRTVSQLWSYCGHGDPGRKLRKGITAEEAAALGNPKAKMLVHLMAESCVKTGVRTIEDSDERKAISKYGQVYLDARHHYEDAVHPVTCVRCGPSGKPAEPGSALSKAHQHANALRKVGKELLKDLWIAAREDYSA